MVVTRMPRRRDTVSRGFTLIELVVVVVILGLLGAIATPRMMNLWSSARVSVINTARGSVLSAATLARTTSLMQTGGPSTSVDMAGVLITMSRYYPTANTSGIVAAAGLDVPQFSVIPGTIVHPPNTVIIRVAGASNPSGCSFYYSSPFVLGNPPVVSAISSAGC